MVTLRAYTFLDSLQPQLASHICTTCKGYFPTPEVASLFVEIAPGLQIHALLEGALKATRALPASIVVERAFGMLELHHEDKGEVIEGGQAVLDSIGLTQDDRITPRIVSNTILRGIEPMHAMIVNKIRFGSMIEPGESLFIFETEPAAYIMLAANEAEKAANVKLVEVRPFGAFGRLYMCGSEADIDEAAKAAVSAIEGVKGAPNPNVKK